MSDEIIARREGTIGRLSLNRPKALHALGPGMIAAMTAMLEEWREDPAIAALLIDHEQGRGFCAGGDVAAARRSVLEDGGLAARAFFRGEYRLNHLLFAWPKPVVAFMDGITMGGGVGIAMPANYRVATENTLFAMPEAAIGLFPDVGGGWYLARLPGRLGPFLALTGARLDGAECLWAGLATHYIPSADLPEAKARIAVNPAAMDSILDEMSINPPEARLARTIERVNRLFASDILEDILSALETDPSEWAAKELATLRAKCPMTMKVALRQIAQGLDVASFAEEMAIEYRLACRMIARPDFAEGVRAVLVDKDNAPRWNPATPQGISESDVDAIFAPLPPEEEWTPL